jgi:hypothetical protein
MSLEFTPLIHESSFSSIVNTLELMIKGVSNNDSKSAAFFTLDKKGGGFTI